MSLLRETHAQNRNGIPGERQNLSCGALSLALSTCGTCNLGEELTVTHANGRSVSTRQPLGLVLSISFRWPANCIVKGDEGGRDPATCSLTPIFIIRQPDARDGYIARWWARETCGRHVNSAKSKWFTYQHDRKLRGGCCDLSVPRRWVSRVRVITVTWKRPVR